MSDNKPKTVFKQSLKAPRLYEGIFLQFINPKAYVVQGHLFIVLSLLFVIFVLLTKIFKSSWKLQLLLLLLIPLKFSKFKFFCSNLFLI